MGTEISRQDGALLLKLARQVIREQLEPERPKRRLEAEQALHKVPDGKRGVFVSLHKKGSLRGCIGNIEPVKPIVEGVVDNAKHAAFNDSRFQPLTRQELDETKIEISILTLPRKVDYASTQELLKKICPGKDGVIIKKSFHQATFLPQVWEQLPSCEEFLDHLCMKAGLPQKAWKEGDLDVSTYRVQSFEEP